MTILGIDLGPSSTGIAITQGSIAEPYSTIKSKSITELVEKIAGIIKKENAQAVTVGQLEGKNQGFFAEFKKRFEKSQPGINVYVIDETLTTRQARQTMIKLQIPKKKKKEKEHQIAACLILQSYLDSNA